MWRLAGTWDFAVDGLAASPIVFDGLAGAEGIIVIIDGLTRSVSGITRVQLSVDDGLNFFDSSGDYLKCTNAGAASADTGINLHTTDATAARSGNLYLQATALPGVAKFTTTIDDHTYAFVGSLDPVSALRVIASEGGDFDGGKIYVMALQEVEEPTLPPPLVSAARKQWVINT